MAKRKSSKKTAPSEAAPEAPLSAPVEETAPDATEETVPHPDTLETAAQATPDAEEPPAADTTESTAVGATDRAEPPVAEATPDATPRRRRRGHGGPAQPPIAETTPGATEPEAEVVPAEPPVVLATPDTEPEVEAVATEDGAAAPAAEAAENTDPGTWPETASTAETSQEPWPWPEGNVEEGQPTLGQPADGSAETGENLPAPEGARLASIVESMLFASDKPLGLSDLKRLIGIRDGKKIAAALEELTEQRMGTGIEVASLSNGWMLRTNPDNAAWVSRLLVGKPMRLSRAMLETLAIVAYRQPVTRPEIDDIRGVDCGPVLKTLLDRGLVRIIGKKEEVGRPMLYGTTPEFLRIFNLRELAELPTLREFYDLSAEDQSRVDAEHGLDKDQPPSAISPKPEVALGAVSRGELPPEPEETDPLIDELDEASQLAKQALGNLEPREGDAPVEGEKAAAEPAAEPSAVPSGE
jgi:segregation and condensation protein B